MSSRSFSKKLMVAILFLGMVFGITLPGKSQSPPLVELILPKNAPVIAERFAQQLVKLDSREKVKVWVYFTDKGISDQKRYQSAINQAERNLTARAGWRRSKTMKPGLVDFSDLPVNPVYINQITRMGGTERQRSRWLNAASFEIPVAELEKVAGLAFVRSIMPVLGGKRTPVSIKTTPEEIRQEKGQFALNYGASYTQLQ